MEHQNKAGDVAKVQGEFDNGKLKKVEEIQVQGAKPGTTWAMKKKGDKREMSFQIDGGEVTYPVLFLFWT